MAIKFTIESIEDVPEVLREYYVEQDGSYVLDVEGATPDASQAESIRKLEATNRAIRKERNAIEQDLKAYRELGDPDEIRDRLEEAESLRDNGAGKEELLDLRKQVRDLIKDRDGLKTKFESQQQELDKLHTLERKTKVGEQLKKIIGNLDNRYDRSKVEALAEDISDSLELDELGDLAPYRGKPVIDYLMSRADLFGFYSKTTPGRSNPGGAAPATQSAEMDFIEEMAAGLKD